MHKKLVLLLMINLIVLVSSETTFFEGGNSIFFVEQDKEVDQSFCGDGNCSGAEDCFSCEVDCGVCGGGGYVRNQLVPASTQEENLTKEPQDSEDVFGRDFPSANKNISSYFMFGIAGLLFLFVVLFFVLKNTRWKE